MLDAIKHITGRYAQVHCVCVWHNPVDWNMWFSCFRILPGSAEAQVTWSGIVKRFLIAYFIPNISAKKYQNPFTCVKVIASQRWDVFLRHGVVICWPIYWLTSDSDRCALTERGQSYLPQSSSSLRSPQLFRPSQTSTFDTHRPLSHWYKLGAHAAEYTAEQYISVLTAADTIKDVNTICFGRHAMKRLHATRPLRFTGMLQVF